MLSYAQNGEDVVLARALAGVEEGFYVDVGAASPNEASVTRHFYEAGWHGINIEPQPDLAAELRVVRARDRNLELAAGAASGVQVFYRVAEDLALSTLSAKTAAEYRAVGLGVEEVRVQISTLSEILEEAEPPRIDFLKIDVESGEADVLAGLDLRRWRPRVILIEATRPNTIVSTYEEYEAVLFEGRYVYAATDGVNRYYAREEEADELLPLLVSANSTDDYIPLREQLLHEEIERLRVYVRHLERDLAIVTERARPDAQAPSATGQIDCPVVLRMRQARVIDLDRIAICSTPQTGAGRLGVALGGALGARNLAADHPADVAWRELPDHCVVELAWPRTEQFSALLSSNGFRVVTLARHPFDTLLALLRLAQVDRATERFLGGSGGLDDPLYRRSPLSDAFAEWATGTRGVALLAVSSTWVADPAVLKVDFTRFGAHPDGVVAELIELGGYSAGSGPVPVKLGEPVDLESIEGGWRRYFTDDLLTRLGPVIGPIAAALGITDLDPEGLPEVAVAEANWQRLVDELGDRRFG